METDDFEWGDAKNAASHTKHAVWFEFGWQVFKDLQAVAEYDDRFDYDEARYTIVGRVDGFLIYLAQADRHGLYWAKRPYPHHHGPQGDER
jgi:uncharacterized DUF497 family protein